MSASNKKKLRKENVSCAMTERQQEELKESKKLKTYSIVFTVVIAVILVAAICIAGSSLVRRSGVLQKNTVAAVVDGNEINSVELSYYYIDSIKKNYEKWSQAYGKDMNLYMLLMGLDMSKPLDAQPYGGGDTTWADYFIEQAVQAAKSDYVLCKLANAEGFALSEEENAALSANKEQLSFFVTQAGFKNFKDYLVRNYGPGSSESTYDAYVQRSALATAFLKKHTDEMTYDAEDIAAYDKEHHNEFSSYSYVSYFVGSANFLGEGTKDADGNVTHTDEETKAALAKAKEAAEMLSKSTSVEELDAAIATLEMNAQSLDKTSHKDVDTLYTQVPEAMQDWISSTSRKSGDIAMLENVITSETDGVEEKELTGYFVVIYQGRNENNDPMANVRHILVNFEGGSMDPTGNTVYSDEEKAAAKVKAEEILKAWKDGAATEESFAELAKEKSGDTGTAAAGGLIENINPGSTYVDSFQDWAIDSSRSAGETGIIESPYGYHVMYYAGDAEQTYRDFMIENTIHRNDLDAWYESIMEPAPAEAKDISYLDTAYVIQAPGQL